MKNNNKINSMLWEELLCGKGPCCGKQQQNKIPCFWRSYSVGRAMLQKNNNKTNSMLLEELQCEKGPCCKKKQQQHKSHALGGATVWEGPCCEKQQQQNTSRAFWATVREGAML